MSDPVTARMTVGRRRSMLVTCRGSEARTPPPSMTPVSTEGANGRASSVSTTSARHWTPLYPGGPCLPQVERLGSRDTLGHATLGPPGRLPSEDRRVRDPWNLLSRSAASADAAPHAGSEHRPVSRRTIMVGFDGSRRARRAARSRVRGGCETQMAPAPSALLRDGSCAIAIVPAGHRAAPGPAHRRARGGLRRVLVVPPWPQGLLGRLRRGTARTSIAPGGCPVIVAGRSQRRPVPHDSPDRVAAR
jgi:hypothetical protein